MCLYYSKNVLHWKGTAGRGVESSLVHFPFFTFSNTESHNYKNKLGGNLRIFCFVVFSL